MHAVWCHISIDLLILELIETLLRFSSSTFHIALFTSKFIPGGRSQPRQSANIIFIVKNEEEAARERSSNVLPISSNNERPWRLAIEAVCGTRTVTPQCSVSASLA